MYLAPSRYPTLKALHAARIFFATAELPRRSLFPPGQDGRVAFVDERRGGKVALHLALRFVPVDLVLHVVLVEPRLGIDIGDAGPQLVGGLADIFRKDLQHRVGARPVLTLL